MARRTRHDLPVVQDKRAQVLELRAQGRTWDQIAGAVGYSGGSAASKAWRAAIKQRPDQTVDEIRAQERERLEAMDSRLADIVTSPPIKSTSIGRVMWDPRSCTCGAGRDPRQEHAADCDVEPVLDEAVVIAAIKERRQVGESYRRLTGADLGGYGQTARDDEFRAQAAASIARLAAARQAEQDRLADREAAVEARERAVTARERALTAAITPQVGDDDVIEAEIVG